MALTDQDGNQLSAIRNGGSDDPTVNEHPLAGRQGGPPLAKVQSVEPLPTAARIEPAFASGELLPTMAKAYGLGGAVESPGPTIHRSFDYDIVRLDDTGLPALITFLNSKGAAGWECFHILTGFKDAQRKTFHHFVHFKREKL